MNQQWELAVDMFVDENKDEILRNWNTGKEGQEMSLTEGGNNANNWFLVSLNILMNSCQKLVPELQD